MSCRTWLQEDGRENLGMATIALSGPDNVGKTTHIRLLADRTDVTNAGPLDAYDRRWKAAKVNGLQHWWFEGAPIEEFVDVLATSYLARAAYAANLSTPGITLVDRGMTMLEATVVATVAARERLDYECAAAHARRLLAPYATDVDAARANEREVLLLHDHDIAKGVQAALSRGWSITPQYAHYQHVLQTHLHASASVDDAIITGGASIMTVHRELCARLNSGGINVPMPAISETHVIALGGLSESGKSTAGAYLQHSHDFARLKIGWLLDGAASRYQIHDIYQLDSVRRAELLVAELDRYLAAHHQQEWVSIESVHNLDLAEDLRALLGHRLVVAYLNVTESRRQARGVAGPDDVIARDVTKRSRGAHQVRDIADIVIDNNGALIELRHQLDLLVRGQHWPTRQPATTTVTALGLPAHLSRYLDRLLHLLTGRADPFINLLAVTGSGSRGKYQHGWSDLDVLIIAEPTNLPAIRRALAEVRRELNGVKLGISLITLAECCAGALTSRLLYVISSIASGETPVLWAAPGFAVPRPDEGTVVSAKWIDATMAAVEIRRLLLREHPDLRALYKVTALLAKIIMTGEGHYRADDRAALEAFCDFTGKRFGALDEARTSREIATGLAEHVLSWWLASVDGAR